MTYSDNTEVRYRQTPDLNQWIWLKGEVGAWEYTWNDWNQGIHDKIVQYATNRRTVVQAGGNQGLYPRLLSNMYERVYTFEPDPANFHCLVQNCQKDNIVKFQAALGSEAEIAKNIPHHPSNTGMNKVQIDTQGNIPLLALDSFTFHDLDLIYLDIELYEIFALQGAKKTIAKHKPMIVMENSTDAIQSFLSGFGYTKRDTVHMDSFYIC